MIYFLKTPQKMFRDFEFTLHNGRVLSQFSVLKKDDRFNYKLDCDRIKIEGAPGFHGSNKIYSLGQPTLVGIENIIKFLGNKKIVWINLKEEPTIYINNLPYIVREKDNPFSNISSFKSITSRNLETLENVLKEDVLNESQKGFIHTFEETQDMKLENKITYLYEIMTNQEIYYHLKSKGYKINYYRVPFPVDQFFSVCQSMNILIDVLEKHRNDDCIFLLTSSNDTKRSLFVLILIKLFYLKSEKRKKILSKANIKNDKNINVGLQEDNNIVDMNKDNNINDMNKDNITVDMNKSNFTVGSIKEVAVNSNINKVNASNTVNSNNTTNNEILTTLDDDSENITVKDLDLDNFEEFIISSIKANWLGSENEIYLILKQCLDGNFRIINNILLVIGEDSKILVDYFIDKHSFPLNLRKKITFDYLKASINNEESYYNKAMLSLERYLALILFDQFMKDYDNQSNIDYISWLNHKPILMNLLDYINEHRHINKALFPLNLLNSEIRSNLVKGMSKIGKFTMLMEFTDKIYNSFGNGIILNSYPDDSTTTGIWINTREEPCIYINNKMYILKEMINYQSNPTFFSGITNEQLEQLEKQIKENLIQEYTKEGKILLFRSSEEDIEEFYIDKKDLNKIETSKEYTKRVVSKDVSYNRVLITAKIALKVTIFDQISSVLGKNTFDYYHIQCGGGGSRGAYTAIIIDLKLGLSNDFLDKKTFIKPIHSLIRILKKGKESFDKVNYLYLKYFGESFVVSSDISDKELEARIKNMFLLVCFASFCLSKTKGTFLDFYNKRKDVQNLFNSIDLLNNKEEIFIVLQNETLENINVIKNRTGKVLGAMTLLKSDYFVGSIVLEQDKESNLPGNFRFIIDKNIIYAGCAMPTQPGVESALKEIQKNLKDKINPLWICLREEPVIYCDGSPYALRYVTKLCENIETTGISYGTLEIVEDELCLDAKNELKKGNILLHNEVMRNGKVIDLGRYVKVDNCETVSNFFSKFKMEFLRIPVTDETAPSPKSIDFFILKLKTCKNINAYIFNCQMGRGRTTTTMIIFYLINNRNKIPKDLPSYPPKYKLIGRIIQVLPNSHLSKRFLDFVIDKFDHIENIRNAIDRHLVNNLSIRKRGKSYLLRYLDLIVFTEFILFGKEKTYQLFREGHPEIESIVKEIEVFELEMI